MWTVGILMWGFLSLINLALWKKSDMRAQGRCIPCSEHLYPLFMYNFQSIFCPEWTEVTLAPCQCKGGQCSDLTLWTGVFDTETKHWSVKILPCLLQIKWKCHEEEPPFRSVSKDNFISASLPVFMTLNFSNFRKILITSVHQDSNL